jgi:hypothetical protein
MKLGAVPPSRLLRKNGVSAYVPLLLNFCKVGIQTAECPIGKNHDPCGTGVFDFCKVAIGDLTGIIHTHESSSIPVRDDSFGENISVITARLDTSPSFPHPPWRRLKAGTTKLWRIQTHLRPLQFTTISLSRRCEFGKGRSAPLFLALDRREA